MGAKAVSPLRFLRGEKRGDGQNDGSTDATPDLMAGYQQEPRIHYLHHPKNIGKSNNMRSGFLVAQGEYFLKFDDDDRLTPDFLSRTVAILDQYPNIDFVGTDHWIIDAENQRDKIEVVLSPSFTFDVPHRS